MYVTMVVRCTTVCNNRPFKVNASSDYYCAETFLLPRILRSNERNKQKQDDDDDDDWGNNELGERTG
jgi:hypothetical protein